MRAVSVVAISLVSFLTACSDLRHPPPVAPNCGSYRVARGNDDSSDYLAEQQCILDAFRRGTPAHLSYEYPSIDSGPITVLLRVAGPRLVEVRLDEADALEFGVPMKRCRRLDIDHSRRAFLVTSRCA